MKKLIILLLGLALWSPASYSQSGNRDLQELRDAYIKALANSNTEGILKVYSDNASVHHLDGTMLQGAQEIKNFYDEFFAENKASIEFKNVSEDPLAKNVIFYHDEVFLQLDGEDAVRKIEVINIAEKMDGKWKVTKSYRWPRPE